MNFFEKSGLRLMQIFCLVVVSFFCVEYVLANDCGNASSGNGREGSCFLPGTLIQMQDGTQKKIEEVQVGDKVRGYDLDNDLFTDNIVEELESPIRTEWFKIDLDNGKTIKTTSEHPIYVKEYDGWASIDPEATRQDTNGKIITRPLEVGQHILSLDETFPMITSIIGFSEKVQTYNLKRVSNNNTFFAESALVHNKGGGKEDVCMAWGACGLTTGSQSRTCYHIDSYGGYVPGDYHTESQACPVPPIGNHDSVSCSNNILRITGWAYDPNQSSKSIDVHFYNNKTGIGSCNANKSSSDVNNSYSITGDHRFDCNVNVSSGDYNIYVWAIDSQNGNNPTIGGTPKSVTCSAPTCTGTVPDSATLCPSDDTGLSSSTTRSLVSSCTATKCEYTCKSGYIKSGNSCVAASCTGTIPANATMFSGDNTGLTANTSYSYGATDTGTRCQYYCNSGYSWNGSSCQAITYSCTGTIPANATMFSGDNTGLTVNTPYTYWATDTGTRCQYYCNSGYSWNGYSCQAITYSCTGTIPANATMFSGDNTGLTVNTPYTYWATDTGTRCQYYCNSGYSWNGYSCQANVYSCTGTAPTNATLCPSDDTGLSSSTARSVVSSCTATKCEYYCNSGYSKSGSVCVANTSSCVSDCSCASSTCTGSTCPNGCGGTCPGTRLPSCGVCSDPCTAGVCGLRTGTRIGIVCNPTGCQPCSPKDCGSCPSGNWREVAP